MAWFRQKNKYWHYCYRENGKEIQVYIGDHDQILARLLPKEKNQGPRKESQGSEKAPRGERTGCQVHRIRKRTRLLPKKKGVRK